MRLKIEATFVFFNPSTDNFFEALDTFKVNSWTFQVKFILLFNIIVY